MRYPGGHKRLVWERVVDDCQAAERVGTMSSALFKKGTREYRAWASRMLLKLKNQRCQTRNPSSGRNSNAARDGKDANGVVKKVYCNIQNRTRWMRYSNYKRRRQRDHRSHLLNDLHSTLEATRHAVDQEWCPPDFDAPDNRAQPHLRGYFQNDVWGSHKKPTMTLHRFDNRTPRKKPRNSPNYGEQTPKH